MKQLVCIEYPGYVNDISKALKTLGGEAQVNATLTDPFVSGCTFNLMTHTIGRVWVTGF